MNQYTITMEVLWTASSKPVVPKGVSRRGAPWGGADVGGGDEDDDDGEGEGFRYHALDESKRADRSSEAPERLGCWPIVSCSPNAGNKVSLSICEYNPPPYRC